MDDIIVGIDLGTTNSCISYWSNNNLQIIPDSNGNRTIPSIVSLTNNSKYVGITAKNQLELNSDNTYYEVKRLIGRKYDDPVIENELQFLSYKIGDNNNSIIIKSNLSKRKPFYSPEEISSFVLTELKQMAESHLNTKIKKAVITVPAYFNDAQRQATKDAMTISGLECVRMINEPTAAALSYGFEKRTELDGKDLNVLVYDLGGGTADVSLLNICEGTFQVLASSGNTHLGGADFDNRLVSYCINTFKKKHNLNDDDLNVSTLALQKLRASCENSKKILSTTNKATIAVKSFHNDLNLLISISRKDYERLCRDLFILCLKPVEDVLESCGLSKSEVDEIVLVGGMTRDPLIKKNLGLFFLGKEPNSSINPDEVVAMGAAIQGYILSDKGNDNHNAFSDNFTLLDIIPLSLGVETIGGVMNVIVPRNSIIPIKKKKKYTTDADYETSVDIKIYEGERKMTKDNFYVGEFILDGLEKAPRGIAEIEISFNIDANGIISVLAEDKKNDENQKRITITSNKGRLSKEKINELVLEAQEMELLDKLERERKQSYYEIDDMCSNIIVNLNSDNNMKEKDKELIKKDVENTIKWLNSKDYSERDKKEYMNVLIKLKNKYGTLSLKSVQSEDVSAKREGIEGTTVFGNEDDEEEQVFELIEDAEFGLGLDDNNKSELKKELKQHRNNLMDLCYSILDVMQDETINKNIKDELKDYIDDTLLWIHVEEKLTIKDYTLKINEINNKCNKLLEDNENVFIADSKTKKNELEQLCLSLKSTIKPDIKSDGEGISLYEQLNKMIDDNIDWLININVMIKRRELTGQDIEYDESSLETECTNRIKELNDICDDIFRNMIHEDSIIEDGDEEGEQLLGESVGTPIFILRGEE